jgi:hypothetical protein
MGAPQSSTLSQKDNPQSKIPRIKFWQEITKKAWNATHAAKPRF